MFASIFHWKARKYIKYRKNWEDYLKEHLDANKQKIWIYSPSIGEFQECKEFVRKITSQHPDCQFIFTFHSPSGYDQAKIPGKDSLRMMLPIDTKKNAEKFLTMVHPIEMYILSTGLWPNFIRGMQKKKIPHFWVSFYSRKSNSFFKPGLKSFYRPLFKSFETIFVYNEEGRSLLKKHFNYSKTVSVNNLRFDCVVEMKKNRRAIEGISEFADEKFCFVAGSTERIENKYIVEAYKELKKLDIKIIIVPHEKRPRTLAKLKRKLGDEMCFYSKGFDPKKKVLVYDITGDLFQLYFHADICMVGRGFHRKEIHNMLEPAVLLKPVIIGPKHQTFIEPKRFIEEKLAFEIHNDKDLIRIIQDFYAGNIEVDKNKIQKMFDENSGGSDIVMETLRKFHEKRNNVKS